MNIQKDFKNIINNAQDRKTFEVIFSKRKEFENFFIYNKNKFEDFIKVLNQYQFKKEINEDELKVIQAKFTEFKKTIEDKNGI